MTVVRCHKRRKRSSLPDTLDLMVEDGVVVFRAPDDASPPEAAEPPPEDAPEAPQGPRLLPGFEGDQAPVKEPRGRGRPRGSKDLAPRSRRTRAEMERSRNPRQRLFYS